MIIGRGMLASSFSKFKDNNKFLIFASGVSNSKEVRLSEFERESNLLKKIIEDNKDKCIVYFGTSSMYDPESCSSPYVQHKIKMEEYIIENCLSYNIFRISQIIGRSNNNTLVNYIINNIINQHEFDVWMFATRNLIYLGDVVRIIDHILTKQILINSIINIANPDNISIVDLIKIIENELRQKAVINFINKGVPYEDIDVSLILPIITELGINFDQQYYSQSIKKIINNDNTGGVML